MVTNHSLFDRVYTDSALELIRLKAQHEATEVGTGRYHGRSV